MISFRFLISLFLRDNYRVREKEKSRERATPTFPFLTLKAVSDNNKEALTGIFPLKRDCLSTGKGGNGEKI